jgi:hypothetical protein
VRIVYRLFKENTEDKNHLEEQGVDGRKGPK